MHGLSDRANDSWNLAKKITEYMEDVQEIIDTCRSYAEGQQRIMRVYENVYM